jgi:hypothetical protein
MKNSDVKTRKKRESGTVKTGKVKRIVSDEDIRKRAYEIYLQNGVTSHNELDNWYKAERELNDIEE